jgi:hypothetical protein
MTVTGVCGEIRLELGVYVLGAIGADRRAVEAHLACCACCRNELAELAGLPGLLNRLTAGDADRVSELAVNDLRPEQRSTGMTKSQIIRTETMPCASDGG